MKVRKDFLPFNRPSIGEKEISSVEACLKSGWITTGPICKEFESEFCRLTGATYAVSLTSATAGMHLVLTALGLEKGDEIITPSLTFVSTVNMIAMRGLEPVFIDIDYDTLNMDVDKLESLVTEKTKAIIPVHFAGAPVNMDKIMEIAERYHLRVIEDAAHAAGTYFKDTHAGGFGHPAIFSFHPIKNITTGEGGMITLQDETLEKAIKLLRFHGIERDAWKRYGKGGNPAYDITTPGFKYNMTDMQAALGLAQLSRLGELNQRRKEIAEIYLKELKGMNGLGLPVCPSYNHVHAWHLFVVKILAMGRERFMEKLAEYNIGYGLHFPAIHLLSYIKNRHKGRKDSLSVTEDVAKIILSLPLYPDMKDDDVYYVCEAIKEIIRHA
jgi:UDP-4-amino-4-deoxy-L-arabinose-oxoglutarate aminotransferase